MKLEDITVRTTRKSSDLQNITDMHQRIYSKEYGLDETFGTYVYGTLSAVLQVNHPLSRLWVAEYNGVMQGTIAIANVEQELAQLRWFLLDESARGIKLDGHLLDTALAYAKEENYSKVMLWTLEGMNDAIKAYKKRGFALDHEEAHKIWGKDLVEQKYILNLK